MFVLFRLIAVRTAVIAVDTGRMPSRLIEIPREKQQTRTILSL